MTDEIGLYFTLQSTCQQRYVIDFKIYDRISVVNLIILAR